MDSNKLIEKEHKYIDMICDKFNYDSNIRHLLYIIIPAFIIKYGIKRENLIRKTFENIKIICSNQENKVVKAYYTTSLRCNENSYFTNKYMIVQNYNNISLIELLDNLIHEFNHAINSYNNEIKVTKNYIYLRTGLTYRIYKKGDLSFVKKEASYILEEIINTKQTEDIINIIKTFDSSNSFFSNTIYAINNETNFNYKSKSYYLGSFVCKKILSNKTFIKTLENLRITGEIYDIDKWFDNIVGKNNSYNELIVFLNDIYNLEVEYSKKKFFKSLILNKIKLISSKIIKIVEMFDNNVNYR
ncbi:MAG: hypothetical protein HFJ11_00535 [Bacilli bacterium]|nr:hypothetical protein [Bacilli bacterium]